MANVFQPKIPTPNFGSQQPQTPLTMAEKFGVAAMLGTLGAGVVLIFMSGWSGAALLLLAVIVMLLAAGGEENVKARTLTAGGWFGLAAAATVIWAPLIVLLTHAFPFSIAGWLAEGLFVLGLASGLLERLKALGRFVAVLLAASACAYLVIMPTPRAFDDPDNADAAWRVALSVRGDDDKPVPGALGYCTVFAPWHARPAALDPTMARRSNAEGAFEPWTFTEDPRLKTVACFALKEAAEDNAGYPAQTALTVGLVPGVTRPVVIRLRENAHPDTAFLVIDARAVTDSPWVQLSMELWDGRPTAPYGGEGPNFIARKGWNLDADGGFVLDARTANADLYLRSVYSDAHDGAVKLFHIGPVAPGSRRRIVVRVND